MASHNTSQAGTRLLWTLAVPPNRHHNHRIMEGPTALHVRSMGSLLECYRNRCELGRLVLLDVGRRRMARIKYVAISGRQRVSMHNRLRRQFQDSGELYFSRDQYEFCGRKPYSASVGLRCPGLSDAARSSCELDWWTLCVEAS